MTSTASLHRVTVLVAAVLLGTSLAGCSSPQADVSSAPEPSATSTSTPTESDSSGAGAPSDSGSTASDGEDALPAALFEEGGMTLEEYAQQHSDVDYLDLTKESVLEEKVGTGTQQITVDAQEGALLRVFLLCPSDATGKTEIRTSRGTEDKSSWMAGSDALCGGWSATTPPIDQAGPMTFTATVENDEPFRMVLTALSE
jgi:hypothetical protein